MIGELVMEHCATQAEALQRWLDDATMMPETKWGASLQLLTRFT